MAAPPRGLEQEAQYGIRCLSVLLTGVDHVPERPIDLRPIQEIGLVPANGYNNGIISTVIQ
jgi:hypothetical protein